ncbi:hypothetical protein ACFFLS_07310 [Flavobacterium procerum]|uniref:Uncharacterized protein n=1 Tax=Flavobacterium procerum TaxID=1455569 RepID=A0ABV6BS33_9FLAO
MTIRQYIEQLKTSKDLNQNTDLENSVAKIEGFQFRMENLFENQKLNPEILSKIEQILNLIFIKEENTNSCFANSEEVRSEYKQSFKIFDLLDYVNAFTHSSFYKESHQISIGTETTFFWEMVKIGSDLRKSEK